MDVTFNRRQAAIAETINKFGENKKSMSNIRFIIMPKRNQQQQQTMMMNMQRIERTKAQFIRRSINKDFFGRDIKRD